MADKIINMDGVAWRIREKDSPTMWDDFLLEARPFNKVTMYKNDFLSWVPDEWTITEVNASTQTLLDERNGILQLTPAGAENDGTNMQLGGSGDGETTGEAWAPSASTNMWFETRVRSSDADQNDFFVGLHVQDTTVVASIGSDAIGFQVADESAAIVGLSRASSVTSSESNLATLADSTFVKLGFKVNGTTSVEYWVNDVLQGTVSTNIPTALMKLTIAHLSGEAAANTFDIDYVVMAQSR